MVLHEKRRTVPERIFGDMQQLLQTARPLADASPESGDSCAQPMMSDKGFAVDEQHDTACFEQSPVVDRATLLLARQHARSALRG